MLREILACIEPRWSPSEPRTPSAPVASVDMGVNPFEARLGSVELRAKVEPGLEARGRSGFTVARPDEGVWGRDQAWYGANPGTLVPRFRPAGREPRRKPESRRRRPAPLSTEEPTWTESPR